MQVDRMFLPLISHEISKLKQTHLTCQSSNVPFIAFSASSSQAMTQEENLIKIRQDLSPRDDHLLVDQKNFGNSSDSLTQYPVYLIRKSDLISQLLSDSANYSLASKDLQS